ncbi:hypothetical protein [uncultured Amnibacterium sp.]|uniref:hypothetical protein n=1 Tax=uncultured Amnibacterium sp. TaxID=1631851 RepID=UPI0035CC25DB
MYSVYSTYDEGTAMDVLHYASASDARAHLKDLLDAAHGGRVATVDRDSERVAVVDATRLRDALAALTDARAEVLFEEGEWAAFLPGLPVHAVSNTLDGAVDELIIGLRQYAFDWTARLRSAPNHTENWGVVQLIGLSTDAQLRDWINAA